MKEIACFQPGSPTHVTDPDFTVMFLISLLEMDTGYEYADPWHLVSASAKCTYIRSGGKQHANKINNAD